MDFPFIIIHIRRDWEIKGSATDFDEKAWYKTLAKTLYMETLMNRHGAIMDQYDPEKQVGLIVDEWGTWFDCRAGHQSGISCISRIRCVTHW